MRCHHCGSSYRCQWISDLYFMGLVVFRLTSRTFFRRYHKRKVFLRCVFWCAWSGGRCDWRCACRCGTGTASDLKSDNDSGFKHPGHWVSWAKFCHLGKKICLGRIFLEEFIYFWANFGAKFYLIWWIVFQALLPLGQFFRDFGHFLYCLVTLPLTHLTWV